MGNEVFSWNDIAQGVFTWGSISGAAVEEKLGNQ